MPVPPSLNLSELEPPTLKIRTDEDVELWKHTRGFRDYAHFVRRLNDAVTGQHCRPTELPAAQSTAAKLVALLQELARWTDDIPPLPTPQRFGNLAFRDWGRRLEERADSLVAGILTDDLKDAVPLLTPYLVTSFGSFVRIDYGTGHELSFALFLLCLSLVGAFQPTPEADREIVLVVFQEYLDTVWKLHDVYKLEPAGSHGVWGLDDYHFLSYLWGSAQLYNTDSVPSDVLRKPLPDSNLYFQSINRIHKAKQGPFHEHSSQLHAIAAQVPHWGKVNSGMFKMYDAEVLSKRVVVQHLPLGGLVAWDPPDTLPVHAQLATSGPRSFSPGASTNILPPARMQGFGRGSGSRPGSGASTPRLGTAAPWATPAPPGGPGGTAAPWATPAPAGGTAAPWAASRAMPPPPPPGTGAPWAAGGDANAAPWASARSMPPPTVIPRRDAPPAPETDSAAS
ncbi:Phosphotyrosyl phosphatase activator [Auricularia subglabra TFB-10046 SS5]|uniref:Serine/threonine-protein phosphatase 2A activator n=1 Tax=Auricularia subglabra (strain TFB-10046 / SS5) TaxID=717982 RepID=J0WVK3_AURST|nr:Phosphotyrosyl phosphatase activator [Auricularia subglabra TFB-10046 SS5]